MASASVTYVDGNAPLASTINGLAQGALGYAQVTANQGSITTEADLTSLTVTVTFVASRRIRISAEGLVSSTVAADVCRVRIKEGSTELQVRDLAITNNTTTQEWYASVVLTPSSGSHTYKLTGARQAGTGTLTVQAGATFPAYILVEDIGSV